MARLKDGVSLPQTGDVYKPTLLGSIILGVVGFSGPAVVESIKYGRVTGEPKGVALTNDDGKGIDTTISRKGRPHLYRKASA